MIKRFLLFASLCACSVPHNGLATQEDGGTEACTTDESCDDGITCTVDTCERGMCQFRPDDTMCRAGERCVPSLRRCQSRDLCVPEECAENMRVGATCEVGACSADMATCGLVPGCAEGESCCGDSNGSCLDCDDGNQCTTDYCEPGCDPSAGADCCRHDLIDGSCDDGLYCTINDRCAPGATASDPPVCVGGMRCETDDLCSEEMRKCLGCSSDAGCPPDMLGDPTACVRDSGMCPTTGTYQETVRRFECGTTGECEMISEAPETFPCPFNPTGIRNCRPAEVSPPERCMREDMSCVGSQRVPTTRYRCTMAGVCESFDATTRQDCDMPVTTLCDGPPDVMTGACTFSNVCTEMGTQEVRTRPAQCNGSGLCNTLGTATVTNQSCTRANQDGTACGPAVDDSCAASGPGSTSCEGVMLMQRTCSGGACTDNAPTACDRPTGTPCGADVITEECTILPNECSGNLIVTTTPKECDGMGGCIDGTPSVVDMGPGSCVETEGESCLDGSLCTSGDMCDDAGVCQPGTTLACGSSDCSGCGASDCVCQEATGLCGCD